MRERTIEKIRAAIKELQQNNKRISVRNVAESASTSKDNARLYIKLYLSSVPDSNGVPDLKDIGDFNSVPDSMSVPDLKGVPDSKSGTVKTGTAESVPDFQSGTVNDDEICVDMYTTPEERADATMAYLNDSNKKVVTRDILEMNEIVDMLFSDF